MRIFFVLVAFVIISILVGPVIAKSVEATQQQWEAEIPRNEIKARRWADALNLRDPYAICNKHGGCAVSYELAADTRLVVGLNCSGKMCEIVE